MDFNSLNVIGQLYAGVDQLVYSYTVTGTSTSVTISGLTGDTDTVYTLRCRYVGALAGANGLLIRLNNDSGSNYGQQIQWAITTSTTSIRELTNTGLTFAYASSGSAVGIGEVIIYAKSGFERVGVYHILNTGRLGTTTIDEVDFGSNTWSNTASEITSIVLTSTSASGIGTGTSFELFARRATG